MGNGNPDDVICELSDGHLTKREFGELMRKVRTNKDYLNPSEYRRLYAQAERAGLRSMTEYQFVQCREAAMFEATGVTRE